MNKVYHISQQATGEEREAVIGQLRRLDALSLEDAISDAPRSTPDEVGRTWRMGHVAGKMMRQLIHWDDKTAPEAKNWVYKVAREWRDSDARLTRSELRTAVPLLEREGLIETKPGYRNDGRKATFYRVNMWETLRVAYSSEVRAVRGRLKHERGVEKRANLEERLGWLQSALDDLNLRFLQPEINVDPSQIDRGRVATSPGTVAKLTPLQERTSGEDVQESHPYQDGAAAPKMENAENDDPFFEEPEYMLDDLEDADPDATSSFGGQPDPQQNHGSEEAVGNLSGVYVAASMGDALLQAIDNTDDTEERRSFESLLLQWQRARERAVLLAPKN